MPRKVPGPQAPAPEPPPPVAGSRAQGGEPFSEPLSKPWTPPAYIPTPQARGGSLSYGLVVLLLVAAVVAGSLAGYIAGSRAPHVVSGLVASGDLPRGSVTVAESLAMINAVKKVGPATVTIRAKQGAPTGTGGAGATLGALGTGIIFDSDGHILTNDHVVAGGETFTVLFAAGKTQVKAKLTGRDPLDDLAVLKVEDKVPGVAEFGSSSDLQPMAGIT